MKISGKWKQVNIEENEGWVNKQTDEQTEEERYVFDTAVLLLIGV